MDTLSVDIDSLIAEAAADPTPWTGLPAGTTLGHMHLKVSDLAAAGKFYSEVIGFDLMATMPQALFVSAGGYHHHLGLNTWISGGAPQQAPESLGLKGFTINVGDPSVIDRLRAAGVSVDKTDRGFFTRDPSGNGVWIR
jgi:catechol 2,3-dioxygenase